MTKLNPALKEMQEQKIIETTAKIELAIAKLPKKLEKVTLSKIINSVCEETGIHSSTIYKNVHYREICNQEFLRRTLTTIGKSKNKDKDTESLINRNRLLELENANLKNQIISLSNALKKSYNSENIDQNKDNNDYKEKFEALLHHFKDQVEIIDGKVVDPFAGIRPVEICKI